MSLEQVWAYAAAALQVLVTFRTLAAIGLGALAYWITPHRYRRLALVAISVAIVLLGYQRPFLLVVIAAVVCGLVYAAVRAGCPRAAILTALVVLYVVLHGLFGLLTFTPWLDWSGLTPAYVLPTIGLTTAFTFLRLVHFSADYARPNELRQRRPDPLTFGAWCLFFPTFVHLPLIRYQAWEIQFADLPRRPTLRDLGTGCYRIGQGLFKGVVIALAFVTLNPNAILLAPAGRGAGELFAAAIASAVLYYVGFSAFMDVGIGAAQLFGIALPENFAPVSQMIRINRMRDFWRNWNITTTRWLNDYVYQPLGGHRRHPVRNVMLTMTACGLWHSVSLLGAAWGAGLGLLLVLEHAWNRQRIRRGWPDLPPALRSVLLLCALSLVNLALTPYAYAAQSAQYFYPLYWLGIAPGR
jgi:alginate O-acetyltransferase complex protein AlgI